MITNGILRQTPGAGSFRRLLGRALTQALPADCLEDGPGVGPRADSPGARFLAAVRCNPFALVTQPPARAGARVPDAPCPSRQGDAQSRARWAQVPIPLDRKSTRLN